MRIGRCLLAGPLCGGVAGIGGAAAYVLAGALTYPTLLNLSAITYALASLTPFFFVFGLLFGLFAVTPYALLREHKGFNLLHDFVAVGALALLLVVLFGGDVLFDSDTMREPEPFEYVRLWLIAWVGSSIGLIPLQFILPGPSRSKIPTEV